ncbi:hypothetical protein BSKO_03254 [Bryopsis sp. KO-2023]|nr:hypothetical protein BSKO_03254 [Bryopsis sp. KO-2023]
MSYRRHTASSAANTNKNQKWTGCIMNGMSTVATRLQTPLYVSENALPPDEDTVAAIQNWLRIPAVSNVSEESILSTLIPGEDEFWTDPQFPPDATSLYVDPSQPPASAPKDVVWERVRGQLYVPSTTGFKLTQGVQSCRWLMGALAAVAARPDLLLDLVVSDRGASFGVYTFQFYKHGCWQQVVIDNSVPFANTGDEERKPLFPSSANPCELWPSLIQKAYAKLHGGYSALMEGSIREALVDLTGGVCEKWKLEDETLQEEAKSGMTHYCRR